MRRLIFWSAVSGVIVLVSITFPLHRSVQQAMAQGCGGWMTPQYSTYDSESTDGSNIYTSVLVDGTASGQCPIGCSCTGVQHHASVNNVIGSVGGTQNGPYVPWNGYVSFENDQSIAAAAGQQFQFSGSGEVICSAVGVLYLANLASKYLSIAETTDYLVRDEGGGVCQVEPDCFDMMAPRCPIGVINVVGSDKTCKPCYVSFTLAYRLSQNTQWACTGASVSNPSGTCPGPCTLP